MKDNKNFYLDVQQRGNLILLREWDANQGREVRRKIKYKPFMFIKSKNKNAKFHDLHGLPLEPVRFDSIREAKDFVSQYEDVEGFKVYGNDNFATQFISREYADVIPYDQSKIRVFNLDIEVHSAVQYYTNDQQIKIKINGNEKLINRNTLQNNLEKLQNKGVQVMTVRDEWEDIEYFRFTQDDAFPKPEIAKWPMTLIGLLDSFDKKYHIWGFGNLDWDPINPCKSYDKIQHRLNIKNNGGQHDLTPDDIVYHDCKDEEELCRKFLLYWSENTPHMYTGWNTEGFDTPYICNRIEQVLGEESVKLLSPWGIVTKRQVEDNYGNLQDKFNILGVNQLDYMDLYKKYTYKTQDNYKLDNISHVELGDGKLSYEEAGNLRTLYRENYQKYVEYNAIDVLCVERIERKKKFLNVVSWMSYYAGVNYEDTFSPVKTWDSIITDYLMKKKIIIPAMTRKEKDRKFAGAFVLDPQVGKHGWLASIDLDSLYPHLIMQFNIGPETMIDNDKLPPDVKSMIDEFEMYDFDEFGDPVIDGPKGRDAYIKRFAHFKNNTEVLKKYPIGMAGNLACFDNRKESFLSELMELNYTGRKFDKQQGLKYDQEAIWMKDELMNRKENSINNRPTIEELTNNRPERLKLNSRFLFEDNLSDDELLKRYHATCDESARLSCSEKSKKILLNSMYGSLGSTSSRWFDIKLAESITLSGQVAIQCIAEAMSNEINRLCGNKKVNGVYEKNYIIGIDTDSVIGETLIDFDGKQTKIEDVYNMISKDNIIKNEENDFVKKVDNHTSIGYNENHIIRRNINYISKHKVDKRLFTLKIGEKSVTMTEDHSAIVIRGGKMITIKPRELTKGDKIVKLVNRNNN